jgi:ribosomal protein S18 acetylase RimI-like enzyme
MELVEDRARRTGADEIALDTAEEAGVLIAWYQRLGYRLVDTADWEITNYRSVVLSKRLRTTTRSP